MTFNWFDDNRPRASIFKLNSDLKNIPEFSNLSDKEMRFVMLVSDALSPCRLLSNNKKRASAVALLGLADADGKANKEGISLMAGENPNVENAIDYFIENFSPRSYQMKQKSLEAYESAYNTQCRVLKYCEDNKLLDAGEEGTLESMVEISNNDVKILTESSKIIKDGLQNKLIEQVEAMELSMDVYPLKLSAAQKASLDEFGSKKDDAQFSFDKVKISK